MMDVALLIKFIGLTTWEFSHAMYAYGMKQNDNYIM